MNFRHTLFGLHPWEVELRISELEQIIAMKEQRLDELERSFRKLEYENETLEMRLKIFEELRLSGHLHTEQQDDFVEL